MKGNCLDLLTERGSLTDLMTRQMGQVPVLNCLLQGKGFAQPLERKMLSIKPRVYSHIREITMGCDHRNWLFARTVIPLDTLRGNAKRLTRIDKTPLGKILFGRRHAIRRSMQLDLINPELESMLKFDIPEDLMLWRRQSIFELKSGPLMISEIFLPDCPIYSSSTYPYCH